MAVMNESDAELSTFKQPLDLTEFIVRHGGRIAVRRRPAGTIFSEMRRRVEGTKTPPRLESQSAQDADSAEATRPVPDSAPHMPNSSMEVLPRTIYEV